MPTELQELQSLEVINLEKNKLMGSIPSEFNEGLLRLRLSKNRLSGTVSGFISDRVSVPLSKQLVDLRLDDNKLNGSMDFIGGLELLRR